MTSRKRKRELISQFEEEAAASTTQEEDQKRKKKERTPQQEEMAAFIGLLDDIHINTFLAKDRCMRISDKYLLAMVLVYLRRGHLRTEEYRRNFFPALFLANQLEEDEEDFRREIYAWTRGTTWTAKKEELLHRRNQLLLRIGFRAWVDRTTCDLVMAEEPLHWAWRRERKIHHSWAIRYYLRDPKEFTTYGPSRIPPSCSLCKALQLHPCKGEICQTDTEEDSGEEE
ncbi:speedy protein 1-A-like [Dendropsophus ebraccatus]|uniref:speedy protein 1-A-like n=1 Tax=Dendropsophus ebraccatus TaxID=150705 RepID=UPI0038319BD2